MIPAVRGVVAARALLLDVSHLSIGGDLAVVAGDAATCQRRETQESNQTHHKRLPSIRTMSNSCTAELDDIAPRRKPSQQIRV